MKVVLVVDMLRGFLESGYPLYCGNRSRQIIPNVKRLLQQEKAAGSKIIFICDSHNPEDKEFMMFPRHCVAGTEEAEIIPELREFAQEIIFKRRYSGFFNTLLDERLKQLNPEKVIIVGVCTDICVMYTAADARSRDYEVEVPVNCVASFSEENHKFALEHMEKVLGVKLRKEA